MFPTRFELAAADHLLDQWGIEPVQKAIISVLLATVALPLRQEVTQVPLSPLLADLLRLNPGADDAKEAIVELTKPRSVLLGAQAVNFCIVDELAYAEQPHEVCFVINSNFAQVVHELGEQFAAEASYGSRAHHLH